MLSSKLGERIKKSRESRKLTQDQLARDLHFSKRTLIEYEKDTSEPAVSRAIAIANYLKVDPIWLVFGEEINTPVFREKVPIYSSQDIEIKRLEKENEVLKKILSKINLLTAIELKSLESPGDPIELKG